MANLTVYYWREDSAEVDYVVAYGSKVIGIEVKSNDEGISEKSASKFAERFPGAKLLLVGKYGIPFEVFMKAELADILRSL